MLIHDSFTELENLKRDPSLHYKVNIGLPVMKPSRRDIYQPRMQHMKLLKTNPEKKLINMPSESDVRKEWLKTCGPYHLKTIAEHYNIYDDLFGEAYFVPRIPLDIKYQLDNEVKMPVFMGNQIKPSEVCLSLIHI